jgi:2-polyprenyl-6-methoxyphenol hydroxylase-like FAD-dependent oxidoreductase
MHRVAIIGAGPFGMFAAAELLRNRDVLVDVFDRLPDPVRPETRFRAVSWGRAGVAGRARPSPTG